MVIQPTQFCVSLVFYAMFFGFIPLSHSIFHWMNMWRHLISMWTVQPKTIRKKNSRINSNRLRTILNHFVSRRDQIANDCFFSLSPYLSSRWNAIGCDLAVSGNSFINLGELMKRLAGVRQHYDREIAIIFYWVFVLQNADRCFSGKLCELFSLSLSLHRSLFFPLFFSPNVSIEKI